MNIIYYQKGKGEIMGNYVKKEDIIRCEKERKEQEECRRKALAEMGIFETDEVEICKKVIESFVYPSYEDFKNLFFERIKHCSINNSRKEIEEIFDPNSSYYVDEEFNVENILININQTRYTNLLNEAGFPISLVCDLVDKMNPIVESMNIDSYGIHNIAEKTYIVEELSENFWDKLNEDNIIKELKNIIWNLY